MNNKITDNENATKQVFEEQLEHFKQTTKEFFATYKKQSGGEDCIEVCLIRTGYRTALEAEKEINRQKAEIERLEKKAKAHCGEWRTKDKSGISVSGYIVCSECNVMIPSYENNRYCLPYLYFCPFCGAEMNNGRNKHHYLKIAPKYYEAISDGSKTFEIRFNDRGYQIGDFLYLQEYSEGKYTGRNIKKEICYLIDDAEYCKEGFVVLGIKDITEEDITEERKRSFLWRLISRLSRVKKS